MAKAKRAIHLMTGPEEMDGVYRWRSLCGFISRWSHNDAKTWPLLSEDREEVTCLHCRREM